MINDFQMFENYMASPTFKKLPEIEKEEFLSSYHNLVEEEMDITLQEAKQYLDQKTIADLFLAYTVIWINNPYLKKTISGILLLVLDLLPWFRIIPLLFSSYFYPLHYRNFPVTN